MSSIKEEYADLPSLRVLVLDRFAAVLSEVIPVPHEIITFSGNSDEEMAALLQNTDVFISSTFKPAWATPDMSDLRLIQGVGAGTEGIDFSAVPEGVTVCNVYGHGYSVAEYTFMTMTVLSRELIAQDRDMRRGDWGGGVFRKGLQERTLLMLGLGHIGEEIARWANFLRMKVIGLTRSPSPERGEELGLAAVGGLDELHHYLPQADYVVVAIPHTPETTGFIGEAEFGLMKSAAFLINVARGPVVDESSLYNALHNWRIAGAAIDVWYHYPATLDESVMPATYLLHELDNIIMTPHNAGTTDGTMAYRFNFMGQNIRRLALGEPLQNIVWPDPPGA